jgi:DNA-binding CsgD family transcriptional regulator
MLGLALRDAHDPAARPVLLSAAVEVFAAAGDMPTAELAGAELTALAEANGSRLLAALAAQASARLALERGDAQAALPVARAAATAWQQLAAPYEFARTRVLIGRALSRLGDAESAGLEFDAARAAFGELGVVGDLAALDGPGATDPTRLTPREVEVLRLVAKGMTNRAIAAELVLSERTVDRHVSNIFAKIDVPSRAAAATYAVEHHLV